MEEEGMRAWDLTRCASGVIQPPLVIDPLHLRRPKVSRSRSSAVGPYNLVLSVLEATESRRAGQLDVVPCRREKVVVSAGVD